MSSNDQDSRAQKEASFHDERIIDGDKRRAPLAYAYVSILDVFEFTRVGPECLDKRILELGCFRGEQALALSGFTGQYTGIDISGAAVDYCNRLGLPSRFRFVVDDANELNSVADGSVDYAFGQGVLHHLDLERFTPNLARKLSPNGFARFVEPAQGNFALRLFRALTPSVRTPDERPFDGASIAALERYFEVKITHHALFRPFIPMLFFNAGLVTAWCRRLDDSLLKKTWLKEQGWMWQIELRRR